MILDNGTLMFNMNMKAGGTPSWGTEMGQGEGYKFNFEDTEEMITSLAYTCVDDIENVRCEFGKGGSRTDDYNIVLAGLYKKVYVNDELLKDAEFLLVVAKQINNPKGNHIGRRTLKYGPNMTYNGTKINKQCFELIKQHLGLNENSAWFVNEINTKNQDELHLKVYVADKEKMLEFNEINERKKFVKQLVLKDVKDRKKGGYNKIYYGAPGTGKSFKIDDEELKEVKEDNKFRITFHPDYSYNDFIGQLLPKVEKKENGEDFITYDFRKGPFTLALEKAYKCPDENIYLIIEEMSRGNCAAIFGDIFQLLDREKEETETKHKDWSKYFVDNDVIAKDIKQITDNKIKIPSNLYILGTVNTSDQNVFVMDTAFKRRFEWEYIDTKPKKDKEGKYVNNIDVEFNDGNEIIKTNWISLYQCINKFISSKEKLGLGEDKQIGQFFIEFDDNNYKEKIKNKLLQYLWFDIQEISYKEDISLFDKDIISFSDLYDKYENNEKIFSKEFIEELK